MDELSRLFSFTEEDIQLIEYEVIKHADPQQSTDYFIFILVNGEDEVHMTITRTHLFYQVLLFPHYTLDNFAYRSAVDLAMKKANDLNWFSREVVGMQVDSDLFGGSKSFLKEYDTEKIDRFLAIYDWLPKEHDEYEQASKMAALLKKHKQHLQFTNQRAGWLYLIKAIMPETHYKIGLSKEPQKRIEAMGVRLPFPIEPLHLIRTDDRYAAEKYLHEKYGDCRVDGEWFKLTDEQVAEICKIRTLFYGGAA